MPTLLFTAFGALFGFVLSRGRVSDYDAIAGMFRLTDLHLFGVIGSAIGTAALGLWLVRRAGNVTVTGAPVDVRRKPWQSGAVWGGLLFGAGWALTGACPGTALVQVGEGKLMAVSTVAGILVGTYAYGLVRSKGEATMRKTMAVAGMVALTLVFATPALAQHEGMAAPGSTTAPQTQPQHTQMPTCAGMMTGMQQDAAPHGGMQPMMGMMTPSDPATMQMRGEMMKAMGEIMMKHAKTMEKPAH